MAGARRLTALDGSLTHRRYQIPAKIPCNWSVAAFPPRLSIASGKAKLGVLSADVRPINDGHTGCIDAFADYAGQIQPGTR